MKSTHYRLERQKSGALAVHSAAYAETMHPGAGPWAEATQLYVRASGLAALLEQRGTEPVVVFDVGLGAAANALAAVACHAELQRRGRRPRPLHLVSFESDPAGARFALAEAAALRYPRGHEAALEALLAHGAAEPAPGVRWALRLGDFPRLIAEEPARADVFFFDPFSPRVNAEMWRLSTLEALYGCRRRAGPARLVTYSTAFSTRAGLLLAGFYVGEGPRQGARRGGTVAAAALGGLEAPLHPGWLARWRRERNPWPPLTPPSAHRALRERLLEHPQWAHFAAAQRGEGPRPAPAPRPKRPAARTPRGPAKPRSTRGTQPAPPRRGRKARRPR